MPESEVAALRRKFGVTVQGANVPNPVTTFEEGSFPGAAAPPHARKCKCTHRCKHGATAPT